MIRPMYAPDVVFFYTDKNELNKFLCDVFFNDDLMRIEPKINFDEYKYPFYDLLVSDNLNQLWPHGRRVGRIFIAENFLSRINSDTVMDLFEPMVNIPQTPFFSPKDNIYVVPNEFFLDTRIENIVRETVWNGHIIDLFMKKIPEGR